MFLGGQQQALTAAVSYWDDCIHKLLKDNGVYSLSNAKH